MGSIAFDQPLQLPLTPEKLSAINAHLSQLVPQEILQWAIDHIPGLHQTTAYGLTGLVAIDMLSKLSSPAPPVIFLDTLYHFTETYELIQEVQTKYHLNLSVYKPYGCQSTFDFEEMYGQALWETNESMYDWAVKVEPAQRAYQEMGVRAVITGRRASQGGSRVTLQPLEVDSTGLLKLNPLFAWSFSQVESYIKERQVPHNKLLSQGYKSVGDWHSTQKSLTGDGGERAGRWAGRQDKTECGLHEDYFKMKAKALSAGKQPQGLVDICSPGAVTAC